jgi:hypothetical protein
MRDEREHENHGGAYECPQQLAMSEVNKRAPCGGLGPARTNQIVGGSNSYK